MLYMLWRYRTSFFVAHAEGYGVPQLRRRLFLLAIRGLNAELAEALSRSAPAHDE